MQSWKRSDKSWQLIVIILLAHKEVKVKVDVLLMILILSDLFSSDSCDYSHIIIKTSSMCKLCVCAGCSKPMCNVSHATTRLSWISICSLSEVNHSLVIKRADTWFCIYQLPAFKYLALILEYKRTGYIALIHYRIFFSSHLPTCSIWLSGRKRLAILARSSWLVWK